MTYYILGCVVVYALIKDEKIGWLTRVVTVLISWAFIIVFICEVLDRILSMLKKIERNTR